MRKALVAVQVLMGMAGIASCRGATAPLPGDASPAASLSASSAAAPPPSLPPSPTQAAEDVEAPAKACLMVNVCSCNLGCASIQVAKSMLREGTTTKVVTGPLQGEEVKIVKVVDSAGASVLALTDRLHDNVCGLPANKILVGYVCARKDSGPVPAKACAKGCD